MRSLILLQLLYASHYPSSCRFLEHFPVDLFWKSWYDLSMPSLTPKIIGGHTYYYARYCQRVDGKPKICLLYTSDAADALLCVDLGGRRIIKKKKKHTKKR